MHRMQRTKQPWPTDIKTKVLKRMETEKQRIQIPETRPKDTKKQRHKDTKTEETKKQRNKE